MPLLAGQGLDHTPAQAGERGQAQRVVSWEGLCDDHQDEIACTNPLPGGGGMSSYSQAFPTFPSDTISEDASLENTSIKILGGVFIGNSYKGSQGWCPLSEDGSLV